MPESELAILVETESRLDRAIAAARAAADAVVEAARARASADARVADDAIAVLRTRITHAVAADTADRVRAIAETARTACTRYDRVREERLTEIARRLARRVAEIAEEDA